VLARALLDAGCRLTPQRAAILAYLDGNRSHPTAADVLAGARQSYPALSLATVYNTLEVLTRLGAVLELPSPVGNRYDPDTRRHVNVICDHCGTIRDVPAAQEIDRLAETVERATGYKLAGRHEVLYYGVCSRCARGIRRHGAGAGGRARARSEAA
jgi:Fur family peroxide stress response transcriptional regulator